MQIEQGITSGLEQCTMPADFEEFSHLDPDELFPIEFNHDFLTDEIKKRMSNDVKKKIKTDSKSFGIFSTRWFMEDWKEAVQTYEGNLSLSADGLWSNSNKKFVMIPIGVCNNNRCVGIHSYS